MGFIKESDVERLMHNEELMGEVAKAIVEDPDTLDELAEDIASKLEDELDNNSALRAMIVDAAVANPEFKKKVAGKITEELC